MEQSIILNIIILFIGMLLGYFAAILLKGPNDNKNIALQSKLQSAEEQANELKENLKLKEAQLDVLREKNEQLHTEKAIAETKSAETEKKVTEQKELLDEAKNKLGETFKALSGESLKSNNAAFIELAKESLKVVLEEAKGDIDKKGETIKSIVKPLEEALGRYEKNISDMEKIRASAYGNLENQIRSLLDSQKTLQQETNNLVTALRRPEVRGRWGEITLKRVAELAGMVEHCDYTEQHSVTTEDGRIRPDMVVHLPSERDIVVDSKVSLDAYLDAIASNNEDERKAHLLRHTQQVKKHMKDLSSKSYWEQFDKTPEFVVMFIPGESFLSAAVDNEPLLIEIGMESKVIIATPTTLVSLLRAISYGWRQEHIAKNALEIAKIGKELYDRFQPFLMHVNKVGGSLSQAVVTFNKMAMSLERRILVSVRKFQELGTVGDKELEEIKQIEQQPMEIKEESA
ncbi:MAG: DNA recombination protein RmuC [Candidatus Omnitrophica bacterium]|nr:DNA recombination protein RmuC [Candidatus Omnitrophota bacterium]